MHKGINLQVTVPVGQDTQAAGAAEQTFITAFTQVNPELQLTVKDWNLPAGGKQALASLTIEGEQDPAANFAALAQSAVQNTLSRLAQASGAAVAFGIPGASEIWEREHENEDDGVVLPPGAPVVSFGVPRQAAPPRPTELPDSVLNTDKPEPPESDYQGCPANGDGGDPILNTRKNRLDEGQWNQVQLRDLLGLRFPNAIGRRPRSEWSAHDQQAVAKYEGLAVQVEGYLAGAKPEGPESCNCHSADDVDNHLWLVDDPNKDRSQSMVCEIGPRVRAQHQNWDFSIIRHVVQQGLPVRLSGWLLMDQEHPEQIGRTRATLWEIHPIIAFEVKQDSDYVNLDDLDASTAFGIDFSVDAMGDIDTTSSDISPASDL